MNEIQQLIDTFKIPQSEFCKKYKIPQRTLAHWLADDRKPPEYVIELLRNDVKHEAKNKKIKEDKI